MKNYKGEIKVIIAMLAILSTWIGILLITVSVYNLLK